MSKSSARHGHGGWWRLVSRVAGGFLLLHLAFAREAHAYLDPGSVSLFFQALLAGLLGGLLLLKRYWQRIKAGLRNIFSAPAKNGRD